MEVPEIPMFAKAKDRVTGLTGVVTARLLYATGCVQYQLEYMNKDKDTLKSCWIDADRLVIMKEEDMSSTPPKAGAKGGPSRGRSPRTGPSRH